MSNIEELRVVVSDLTKRNIQLRDDLDRMERQLAAAERLYLATLDYLNAWEDTDELESNLKDALTDYANAKGEK